MINRLKVQTASVVVPIGLLHMGAARHRALLYKVLAGNLGLPCRILKGRRLVGNDSEHARVVVRCGGQELYIDLLARPGGMQRRCVACCARDGRGIPTAEPCRSCRAAPRRPVTQPLPPAVLCRAGEVSPVPPDEQQAELPDSGSLGSLRPRAAQQAAQPPASSQEQGVPVEAGAGHSSQPLPSLARMLSPPGHGLHSFDSAPISPFQGAPLRSSGSSAASGASRAACGVVPLPSLTEEDRTLLEAMDSTGPSPHAARRSAAAAAPINRPALRPLPAAQPPQQEALAQQRTLPAPVQPGLSQAEGAAAFPGRLGSPQRSASSLGSQQPPLDLSQAMSLEHALHLAAEAAMGGDSLLGRGSGSSQAGSQAGSVALGGGSVHRGGSLAGSAGRSSAGALASRASTGRQDSMGRWDSQSLGFGDVHMARATSQALSARSRRSSGALPGGLRSWEGARPRTAAWRVEACAAQSMPPGGLTTAHLPATDPRRWVGRGGRAARHPGPAACG